MFSQTLVQRTRSRPLKLRRSFRSWETAPERSLPIVFLPSFRDRKQTSHALSLILHGFLGALSLEDVEIDRYIDSKNKRRPFASQKLSCMI